MCHIWTPSTSLMPRVHRAAPGLSRGCRGPGRFPIQADAVSTQAPFGLRGPEWAARCCSRRTCPHSRAAGSPGDPLDPQAGRGRLAAFLPRALPHPAPVRGAPKEVVDPSSGRATLLESIRQAGGVGKAKLRSVAERKLEKKKQKEQGQGEGPPHRCAGLRGGVGGPLGSRVTPAHFPAAWAVPGSGAREPARRTVLSKLVGDRPPHAAATVTRASGTVSCARRWF